MDSVYGVFVACDLYCSRSEIEYKVLFKERCTM